MPLLWLVALCAFIASVALLLATGIRRAPLPRDRRTWLLIACLGLVNVAEAMRLLAVLAEAGTGPERVAKLTIYLAAGVDPGSAYAATRSVWGDHRTAVTVLAVSPARPGALFEIEAVATLPEH